MPGSILQWWLVTAADVRELARKAKEQLLARPDIAEARELYERFRHRKDEEGNVIDITDDYKEWASQFKYDTAESVAQVSLVHGYQGRNHIYQYDRDTVLEERIEQLVPALMEFSQTHEQSADLFPDEKSAYKALHGLLKKHQQLLTPMFGKMIPEMLDYLEESYPDSYKLWPWAVKQAKQHIVEWNLRSRVNLTGSAFEQPAIGYSMRNLGLDHVADIAGQAGSLLAEMRAENRVPEGFDVNRLSFKELEAWVYEQHNAQDAEAYSQDEIAYQFPDGWTIRHVTSEESLAMEGQLMGHCVGGYCQRVEFGDSVIYSLRDPKNQPHVTLEFVGQWEYGPEGEVNKGMQYPDSRPGERVIFAPHTHPKGEGGRSEWNVVQIQGKEDKEPIDKYKERIRAWFDHLKSTGVTVQWADQSYQHGFDDDYGRVSNTQELVDWYEWVQDKLSAVDEYGLPNEPDSPSVPDWDALYKDILYTLVNDYDRGKYRTNWQIAARALFALFVVEDSDSPAFFEGWQQKLSEIIWDWQTDDFYTWEYIDKQIAEDLDLEEEEFDEMRMNDDPRYIELRDKYQEEHENDMYGDCYKFINYVYYLGTKKVIDLPNKSTLENFKWPEYQTLVDAPWPKSEEQSTDIPGAIARTASLNLESIFEGIVMNNGGAWYPDDFSPFSSDHGYVVSVAGHERVIPLEELTPEVIEKYLVDHANALAEPDALFGAWVDEGRVYLDSSRFFNDLEEAMQFGRDNGQKAIWDAGAELALPVTDEPEDGLGLVPQFAHKTAGTTLYHAAPIDARESILARGLDLGEPYNWGPAVPNWDYIHQFGEGAGDLSHQRVLLGEEPTFDQYGDLDFIGGDPDAWQYSAHRRLYLMETPEGAAEFYENYRGTFYDIWAVSVPTDLPLWKDPRSYNEMPEHPTAYFTYVPIPPEYLHLYETPWGEFNQSPRGLVGKIARTTMYHVASPADRESILQHGIDYTRRKGYEVDRIDHDPATDLPYANYIWDTLENAYKYGQYYNEPYDIYRVDVSGLQLERDPYFDSHTPDKVGPDHFVGPHGIMGAFFTWDIIPPDRVELIYSHDDAEFEGWWDDLGVEMDAMTPFSKITATPPPNLLEVLRRFDEAGVVCEGWTCDGGAAVLSKLLDNAGIPHTPVVGLYWWPVERKEMREQMTGPLGDDELDEHHHWIETADGWLIDPNGEIREEPRIQRVEDARERYEPRYDLDILQFSPWYQPPSNEDWERGIDGELIPYTEPEYEHEKPAWKMLFGHIADVVPEDVKKFVVPVPPRRSGLEVALARWQD